VTLTRHRPTRAMQPDAAMRPQYHSHFDGRNRLDGSLHIANWPSKLPSKEGRLSQAAYSLIVPNGHARAPIGVSAFFKALKDQGSQFDVFFATLTVLFAAIGTPQDAESGSREARSPDHRLDVAPQADRWLHSLEQPKTDHMRVARAWAKAGSQPHRRRRSSEFDGVAAFHFRCRLTAVE
jgi:hypothetical protein